MSRLDLRIQYKRETGTSPTYGRDEWGHNYKNGLTKEYIQRLEGNRANELHLKYQFDTGRLPLFKKKENQKIVIKYFKHYKEWLEDFTLNY